MRRLQQQAQGVQQQAAAALRLRAAMLLLTGLLQAVLVRAACPATTKEAQRTMQRARQELMPAMMPALRAAAAMAMAILTATMQASKGRLERRPPQLARRRPSSGLARAGSPAHLCQSSFSTARRLHSRHRRQMLLLRLRRLLRLQVLLAKLLR